MAKAKKVPWVFTTYRHELKFYLNLQEYEVLKGRISAALRLDSYAEERGSYHIRSLYFDDIHNSAIIDKLSGVMDRKKFRIRTYDFSDETIKLERKVKSGQFIRKDSLPLTREEYEAIISGNFGFLADKKEAPAMAMYIQMRNQLMRPKTIVDFTREPFIYPVEDVRVTFDKDLRMGLCGVYGFDIFNRDLLTMPAVTDGLVIMEIKFNNFLPTIIHKLIQGPNNARSSISKYVLCRRYE
ncbi:MAG: polyphosphate polymerase domain-containing protein [Bacillota bacterium]|nr:polyphosphate polymerase domain-containing protein [Bacillota bacterium]